MKIDVYFTPVGSRETDLAGRGVVVIDVLRATTTIVAAIANGARAVVPAASAEEAVRMTANLERDGYLLAGERRAVRIEGFALGNSPREVTPEAVAGRTIFLATTNGTPALVAAQAGEPVMVGAAVNFSALVERARESFAGTGELAIVCAGRERQFALEDAYAAGRLVKAVKRGRRGVELNDAARVALAITDDFTDWEAALKVSIAARQLREADLGDDVSFCATGDRYGVVPTFADRRIT
jgi:2-phosphosulfolactate phosphatase